MTRSGPIASQPRGTYDDLQLVQAENRDLRATIEALRDELERTRAGNDERIQQAVAAANDEIRQLHATVAALREAMDRNKIAFEERGQEAERAARQEIEELQETVRLLRDQLGEQVAGRQAG